MRNLGLLTASCTLLFACSRESTGESQPEDPPEPKSEASSTASSAPEPRPAPSAQAPDAEPPSDVVTIETDGGTIVGAKAERVLHVGDSMTPLVGFYLRPLYQADDRSYWVEAEDSSSTLSWDNDRKLQELVYKYKPQLVLISLGSNELFDREPERRGGAIRRLVDDVRGRACVWIGPPAWKKDFGFVNVLRENLGHCRYLDSTKLALPRMKDGRHPSWTGGHRWATAVWKLLGGTTAVPARSFSPDP